MMSTQPLLLFDPLLFLLLWINYIRLYKTLSYRSHALCFVDIMVYIYLCTFLYVYILLSGTPIDHFSARKLSYFNSARYLYTKYAYQSNKITKKCISFIDLYLSISTWYIF